MGPKSVRRLVNFWVSFKGGENQVIHLFRRLESICQKGEILLRLEKRGKKRISKCRG